MEGAMLVKRYRSDTIDYVHLYTSCVGQRLTLVTEFSLPPSTALAPPCRGGGGVANRETTHHILRYSSR